jgi:pimeloyl-ACP methyl ester carboxylesterase
MSRALHGFVWKQGVALLVLLSLSVSACGSPTSAPTPEPPTPVPTAVLPVPTATPFPPTDTPVPPTDTPTPEPTPAPSTGLEKASCPFDLPPGQVEGTTIECGTLVVPEDRSNPEGAKIRLAVAVFHPDGKPEADPIFYLEGGPGGSPLELIDLTFDDQFEPLLATNRDLVVFDQRGVGLSRPALDCPKLSDLTMDLLDGELDGKQLTEKEVYDQVLETTLACGQDLRKTADLSAYHAASNAADVNDLRLALGYDQVNLWGSSYGTNLALAVMRDYPEGVRSVVLDSTLPPDADWNLEAPPNADRAFTVLFEGCAADAACNAAYPDLRTVFFDTVDKLNKTPATFETTDALTMDTYQVQMYGDDFMGTVLQYLYATDVIPALPQMIYDASQGNFDLLARILGALLMVRETMSRGMFYSSECHDEMVFSSLEEFEAVLEDYRDVAGIFEYSSLGAMGYDVCAGWGAGEAGAIENQPVTSAIPTLILSGEYDPVTPPAWGKQVAKTLDNGYFFEYPGMGHGVSAMAGCPRDMMIAFLEDPTAAPDDACIAKMGPPRFVVPAESGAVTLEPFVNEQMGIQGVLPAGWTEISVGAYARGASATDSAAVIAQSAQMTADDLLGLFTTQLGLDTKPESVGQREANGLTWTLYSFKVQGLSIDMALAESGGQGLVVILQSEPRERNALYEAVFLPVIDALTPIQK